VASLVFTTDETQHTRLKRPIARAYSLSTVVEFEGLVDSTTAILLGRLDELYAGARPSDRGKDGTGKICDLGAWIGWYAFDVIDELTFWRRLGFLDTAGDVEGISESIKANCGGWRVLLLLGRWGWR
jgi:hypothetical protein